MLWAIAVGGEEHTPTMEDYEATIGMLTGLLYTIAQLPNGTHAQQRAFKAFRSLAHSIHLGTAPVRAVEHAGACPLHPAAHDAGWQHGCDDSPIPAD